MNIYRQGDFLFKGIAKLPNNLKKQNNKIVGYGEMTGHTHRFEGNQVVDILLANDGLRYLNVLEPATIIHEEHDPIIILPGSYEIINEREYNYADKEMQKVVD